MEALIGQITLSGVRLHRLGRGRRRHHDGRHRHGRAGRADPGLPVDRQQGGAAGRATTRPSRPLPVYVDPTTAAAAAGGSAVVAGHRSSPITARMAGVLPRFPDRGRAVRGGRRGRRWPMRSTAASPVPVRSRTVAVGHRATGRAGGRRWAGRRSTCSRSTLRQSRVDRLAGDPVARGAAGLLHRQRGAGVPGRAARPGPAGAGRAAGRRRRSCTPGRATGSRRRTLRRSLFLRALAVVVVGVPGGVLIGLVLSRITTALVRLTATGAEPGTAAGAGRQSTVDGRSWSAPAIAGRAAGLCAWSAAAALRERLPRRPEEGLR